jgi:hypothetical protein
MPSLYALVTFILGKSQTKPCPVFLTRCATDGTSDHMDVVCQKDRTGLGLAWVYTDGKK